MVKQLLEIVKLQNNSLVNRMPLWNKSQLISALSNQLLRENLAEDLQINEVVIDSRKANPNSLFIAFKGENNDGHDFIEMAKENGCKAFIIHDSKALDEVKDSNFILVKNTFEALYQLAEFSRNRSQAKIIAITGSVGKTNVKEMIKSLLIEQSDKAENIFANPGNLNNHIGTPLSLCNFSANCKFGVFEMGMNHLGEIEQLSKLVKPHLAIITTVTSAHIENFKNEEEIALAKSEIFSGLTENGIVLLNKDNCHFDFLKKRAQELKIAEKNIFTFAQENSANYQILKSKITGTNSSLITAQLKNSEELSYQISSSNQIAAFNSIIAVACLDLLNANVKKAVKAFENFSVSKGRGQIIETLFQNKNITIIDDSYNANIASMISGLNYANSLKQILGKKRLIVALGDMLELGEKSVELHEELIKYLANLPIGFAILVGLEISKAAKNLPENLYKSFPDSSSASQFIEALIEDGDLLYVKGSRGIKMEKLIEILTN